MCLGSDSSSGRPWMSPRATKASDCHPAAYVAERRRSLPWRVAVGVADVATQLWHPLKISFTASCNILELTKSKSVLLHGAVAPLHSSSSTASVSAYSYFQTMSWKHKRVVLNPIIWHSQTLEGRLSRPDSHLNHRQIQNCVFLLGSSLWLTCMVSSAACTDLNLRQNGPLGPSLSILLNVSNGSNLFSAFLRMRPKQMALYCSLKSYCFQCRWTQWQIENWLLQWGLMGTDCWAVFTWLWMRTAGVGDRGKTVWIHPDCSHLSAAWFDFLQLFIHLTGKCLGRNIKNNNSCVSSPGAAWHHSWYFKALFSRPIRTLDFAARILSLMDVESPIYGEVWVLSAGA